MNKGIVLIIEEGSVIKIIDKNDIDRAVVDKMIVQHDIEIEDNGSGCCFLLRHRECNENCIFESDKIYKTDKEYVVEGYFKDAILVIADKYENVMYESYTAYDN